MTERELEPHTTHNLAPTPKPEPARELGLPPEALHRDEQTLIRRLRQALRQAEQFIADYGQLQQRARDAQKQPFPSGGAEGSRRSGTSDPTSRAALHHRIKDPAEKAIDAIDTAIRAIRTADLHRTRALQMTEAEGVLAELDDDEQEQAAADNDACTNHAKIGEYERRGEPPSVPNGSTLCVWCYQISREYGRVPTRELMRLRRERGRLFKRDYDNSFQRASQPGNPHR